MSPDREENGQTPANFLLCFCFFAFLFCVALFSFVFCFVFIWFCFVLLCFRFVLLCFALFVFVLLCFALLVFVFLYFALFVFVLLCSMLSASIVMVLFSFPRISCSPIPNLARCSKGSTRQPNHKRFNHQRHRGR
jgi:hypothetical protein